MNLRPFLGLRGRVGKPLGDWTPRQELPLRATCSGAPTDGSDLLTTYRLRQPQLALQGKPQRKRIVQHLLLYPIRSFSGALVHEPSKAGMDRPSICLVANILVPSRATPTEERCRIPAEGAALVRPRDSDFSECVGTLSQNIAKTKVTDVNRWDEKAGPRRDAIRSQVIDALEPQEIDKGGRQWRRLALQRHRGSKKLKSRN
jgi:hypothetical protein